jgi:hypothetical protein
MSRQLGEFSLGAFFSGPLYFALEYGFAEFDTVVL